MDGLSERIRRLREEVEIALLLGRTGPAGIRLEAERVVLNLPLPADWGTVGGSAAPPTASVNGSHIPAHLAGESPAQLTIEFRVHVAQGTQPGGGVPHMPSQLSPEALRALILDTGTAVFGPLGFDNSARAEVFCELVAEMTIEDITDALNLLAMGSGANRPGLERPLARLRQLLGFSPLGREKSAERLLHLFHQTSASEVVSTLASQWRFGTHWPLR